MLFSTLPNANDFAPIKGNKFSSVGETTLSMPDRVIIRRLTITMTDGIGFLVILLKALKAMSMLWKR